MLSRILILVQVWYTETIWSLPDQSCYSAVAAALLTTSEQPSAAEPCWLSDFVAGWSDSSADAFVGAVIFEPGKYSVRLWHYEWQNKYYYFLIK